MSRYILLDKFCKTLHEVYCNFMTLDEGKLKYMNGFQGWMHVMCVQAILILRYYDGIYDDVYWSKIFQLSSTFTFVTKINRVMFNLLIRPCTTICMALSFIFFTMYTALTCTFKKFPLPISCVLYIRKLYSIWMFGEMYMIMTFYYINSATPPKDYFQDLSDRNCLNQWITIFPLILCVRIAAHPDTNSDTTHR